MLPVTRSRTILHWCFRQRKWLCICLLLSGGILSSAYGENLWKKRKDRHAFLFIDSKARSVGDLVTIIVSEDTDVDTREDRGAAKSSRATAGLTFAGGTGGGLGTQAADGSVDVDKNSSRSFDGESSFRSNAAITDRMTVTVMDVLPNGNMVLSGKRTVRVAGDQRTLILTGMVRAIDIGPDNTVNSRHIAELKLMYEPAGPAQRFARQGWFGRAANAIWPF